MLPSAPAQVEWPVWSATAQVVVTDPEVLTPVRKVVEHTLAEIDLAASRFRPDSEVCRLAARRTAGPVEISAVLADLVRTAVDAARRTNGAVDPTLGVDLAGLGYDRDIADVRHRVRLSSGISFTVRRPVTWQDIDLHGRTLRMPAGVLLDLGATAKARAADLAAVSAADRLGCGVLVNLGGDLRVAGAAPKGGWQILVQDGPDEPISRIGLDGAVAVATSSTLHRAWTRRTPHGMRSAHHILDPVLRQPAASVWRTVSVAAEECVAANTLSTAAIVRGTGALALLEDAGAPARLIDRDGASTCVGGWPV